MERSQSGSVLPGKALLGTTYVGYQPELTERLLPLVDALEITPDILRLDPADGGRLDPAALAELRDYASEVSILVHGIGLSIGSAGRWKRSSGRTRGGRPRLAGRSAANEVARCLLHSVGLRGGSLIWDADRPGKPRDAR